jgi:glycosyltransferase involved in cell wall biosynthesis
MPGFLEGVRRVIAVVVCDFGDVNGGAARVAIDSARGLAESGYDVIYVCAIPPISARLDHPRITVRCIALANVWDRANPLAAAAQGIWNFRARRALEAILEPLPRDHTVVHFHQWTKALSPSVLLAPLRRGLPAIATLHDYFMVCPNGAYYHFPAAQPCRLKPLSVRCTIAGCDRIGYAHKFIRVLRQWATRAALARCGSSLRILNVSAKAGSIVEPFLPPSHARFVVHSPIDIPAQPAVEVARNQEFVFVGRLTEEKGVRLLAEVARDAGLPLTIVGDGPLMPELQRVGGSVRCTGWLEGAALAAVMARARALVFPSTWYETAGLVVIEGLARGIPAIVSRRTAAVDVVADDINGLSFDPEDRSALLACLRRLGDDATVARLGREAYRRYWSDPPTIASHARHLLAVYERLLGGQGIPGAPSSQAADLATGRSDSPARLDA